MKIRKILALLLCTLMVLSMIPVMFVTTASAAAEGDWYTCRKPSKNPNPETYTPAPGYHYTSEGFETINADYKDCSPYFNVMSKERWNMKDGFHMEFRVDDFSYGGESGTADHWLCFAIWNADNISPGSTSWGEGWLALMRGNGDGGSISIESFVTTAKNEEEGIAGNFEHTGNVSSTAPMDDNGRELYTLDVDWNGSAYEIKVNGQLVSGSTGVVTDFLQQRNAAGDFYIGIAMHAGVKNGVAGLTITDVNGAVPTGSDSAEPQENVNVVADPIDPTTVPENMPCMYFDATFSTVNHFGDSPTYSGTNMELMALGDNSFHATCVAGACYFGWSPKRTLTYLAEDFPVFAMMFRDFYNMGGSLWYCGGEIISAQNDCVKGWSIYDDDNLTYGKDEEYTLCISDLSDLWEGRINNIRIDFSIYDVEDPESAEFDVMWMGFFRSVEEAQAFANAKMAEILGEQETTDDTEPVETDESKPAQETDTKAPETETEPAKDTVADTGAESAPETAGETTDMTTEGCASVVGGATALILTAMAAAVALKKK